MATESTKDGSIGGDQSTLDRIAVTETPQGTVFRPSAPVSGLSVEVTGRQTWTGSTVTGSTYRFGGSSSSNALYTPQNELTLGIKSSKNTFKGSGGEDSIAFRKSSKKDIINLGNQDNAADVVKVDSLKKVKDLKIRNFGQEDTLKIGGKSFDYDKLQDKSFKNISIKFD
jgi:hypothetical protein